MFKQRCENVQASLRSLQLVLHSNKLVDQLKVTLLKISCPLTQLIYYFGYLGVFLSQSNQNKLEQKILPTAHLLTHVWKYS